MTEKRFTYDSKTVSILKDGEFWLDGNVDTACNHSEICNELNKLAEENEELKEGFEITLEKAFDRYMDSPKAEEVMDYIHDEFYKIIGV